MFVVVVFLCMNTEVKLACRNWSDFSFCCGYYSLAQRGLAELPNLTRHVLKYHLAVPCILMRKMTVISHQHIFPLWRAGGPSIDILDSLSVPDEADISKDGWYLCYDTATFLCPHVSSRGLVGQNSWKSHCLHSRHFS